MNVFKFRRLEWEFCEMLPWTVEVAPKEQGSGLCGKGLECGGEIGKGAFGSGSVDFVLDDDVGPVALAVLRGEPGGEGPGEAGVKGDEGGGFHLEGDAAAEGAETDDGDGKGRDSGCSGDLGGDYGELCGGEVVKEGDVSGNEVAFWWEVALAEGLKMLLGGWLKGKGENEGLAVHRVTLAVNKDGDGSPLH
jgi:hypothetical protein